MADNKKKYKWIKRINNNIKNQQNKTKYQLLEIPGLINTYIFKDQSKAILIFFRFHKSTCRITIEINRENINKI